MMQRHVCDLHRATMSARVVGEASVMTHPNPASSMPVPPSSGCAGTTKPLPRPVVHAPRYAVTGGVGGVDSDTIGKRRAPGFSHTLHATERGWVVGGDDVGASSQSFIHNLPVE